MRSISCYLVVSLAFVALAACGKDDAVPSPAPAEAAPSPTAAPAAAPVDAAPADPFALGSCEYTVDGAAANKGGGGIRNVQSIHWMPADQPGRALASPLLINCGAGPQINLMSNGEGDVIPLGPKTYPITRSNAPGEFAVIGPDFMNGEGSLEITAWDRSHVAGSFNFVAGGRRYAGTFDLACPNAASGGCT